MFCVCHAVLSVHISFLSSAGKGLPLGSLVSGVSGVFLYFLSLFNVVSWVRCGT